MRGRRGRGRAVPPALAPIYHGMRLLATCMRRTPSLPAPCRACPLPPPAGEPKGQTYGGVYQPGPEERGAAEAATYSAPTRE